ncbi:amylo-alpha-1,6-glucosidase [Anaerocolumna xylanovorans]|uniref:Glycogen debranching enzyme (Alpha-1,6-glucosidase) n=1 Tax=Anaerocolumna xylanovorans DSM 12503 TaxID=1121345 RepID=A0A1M7XX27_9FIRM|nr:amylo-alpha-1,6-glucosidase [Anaerocolumna xylanovorans]SHO43397.1 Glycogen debranching enzyme (alpha-1,6-glucosidase) [Anaerocolumna xylanovorans DSM 12503]
MYSVKTKSTKPMYVCSNERIKLIGTIDGYFPDFGHHLEKEMGGLWLHPIKLLDGFWLKFTDHTSSTVDSYILSDGFENFPHKNVFYYGNSLGHTPVTIKRTQLAPLNLNGIIITYEFVNRSSTVRQLSASFLARTDLSPVWLSEEAGIYDGRADEMEYLPEASGYYAKDSDNPWHLMIGSNVKEDNSRIGQFFGPEITSGRGISLALDYSFALKEGESKTLQFFATGSDCSKEECFEQFQRIRSGEDFEAEKIEHYRKITEQAKLKVGDTDFETVFDWIKINTDWLIVDTSKYGRAIAAGIPEYPWWFGCDSFYTLQGVLALGDFKLCRDTLSLLLNYSRQLNGNGRIVHEITTNGCSPNLGNTQETAHFISALWKYYEWTKDEDFLREAYDYVKLSIKWLLEQDDDKDYFPTGYGIIEIAGLNMEMIDSAVYTAEAYECYAKMCDLIGEKEESKIFAELAEKTKEAINTKFWEEETGLYCDAHASNAAVNKKRDIIIGQLKEAKNSEAKEYVKRILAEREGQAEEECGWLLNRNWIINTPMETGIAPKDKAERALKKLHTSQFIGTYGMYLDGLKQDATMTISTGVMAAAQARYGYSDRALELLERMFASFSKSTPGSISEMSPDYGCFVQAWTTYAAVVPVVNYFFGIQPHAYENVISFEPSMPEKWKKASLEKIRVLDGELDIFYENNNGKKIFRVRNTSSAKLVIKEEADYQVID